MGLLETIAIILIVLWIAGIIFHIFGGFIHILLVIALVIFIVRFLQRGA